MARLGSLGFIVVCVVGSWAVVSAPASPPTIEEQRHHLERLLPYLILLSVSPKPDPLEDPMFVPRRHGMGVRVARSGQVVVLTSAALVDGVGPIEVSTALAPDRTVKSSAHPEVGGLAEVRCEGAIGGGLLQGPSPCSEGPAASVAPAGACDPERVLYAVVPAGIGSFVLATTVVAARGGVLPDDLALVHGRFPEGTPLFDADDRVAALVVRPAWDSSNRCLAAPLSPMSPTTAVGPDESTTKR